MKYTRPATLVDMVDLATRLRKADELEVRSLGFSPMDALELGLINSERCLAMTPEGRLVGVYGICPTDMDGVGLIWMLASDDLIGHQVKFLKNSRAAVQDLIGDYQLAYNYTDARNTLHHAWLRWCGAIALRKVPMGINGEEYIEFVIRKE